MISNIKNVTIFTFIFSAILSLNAISSEKKEKQQEMEFMHPTCIESIYGGNPKDVNPAKYETFNCHSQTKPFIKFIEYIRASLNSMKFVTEHFYPKKNIMIKR